MKNFYSQKIAQKKEENLYRKLVKSDVENDIFIKRGAKKLVSFASNDYFNLSQNLQVKKAAILAIEKFGTGAGASRYISGNNSLYSKLEKQIAKFKNCDESIVFSSGYSCAIGVIPALVSKGDLIIADRLIHSSLIDGAKLSGAKLLRFPHNDIHFAAEILKQNRHQFNKCLIITETIFSMDGDIGEVTKLAKLAAEFDAILISDDAHGLFEYQSEKCDHFHLKIGTLSKALGSIGGYVAGDKILIDYLRNFAKSQIYSTALPPAVLASASKALQIIKKKNLAQKTLENARYFCNLMNLSEPRSAIVPIIIGDCAKVLEIAHNLEKNGFLIGAIRYPTVEKNKARLRLTFTNKHTKQQIKKLTESLLKLL